MPYHEPRIAVNECNSTGTSHTTTLFSGQPAYGFMDDNKTNTSAFSAALPTYRTFYPDPYNFIGMDGKSFMGTAACYQPNLGAFAQMRWKC